jgi:hypothetical protein
VEAVPDARRAARDNREFLGRAVRFLAADAGIDQFLDIGTGLPTRGNVHEIARSVNPDARVVYSDNDPIVHVHASACSPAAVIPASSWPTCATLRPSSAILRSGN